MCGRDSKEERVQCSRQQISAVFCAWQVLNLFLGFREGQDRQDGLVYGASHITTTEKISPRKPERGSGTGYTQARLSLKSRSEI